MKAVVPTGGRGTRMQPITFSTNKHFIPVGEKPLIFYPIEAVAEAGIKDVAITYNPGWLDLVKNYLGDGTRWGMRFTYILQEEPKGLANIFQVCEEYLAGEPFLMHLGDNIFVDGIKEQVNYFEKKKPHALAVIVHHKDNSRMGVPYFDKRGRLIKYVEKPKNPPHDLAVVGLYFFTYHVFGCFKGKGKIRPSKRGELEISSPYQWLIDHGFKVDTIEYKGVWLDPGKFDDWIEANRFLLDRFVKREIEGYIDKKSQIQGRVKIKSKTRVINSLVRGPVSIGEGVYIKDSYIGPYTSIDDFCIVKESVIENSVIMRNVIINGIKEGIDGSLIGHNSEVVKSDGRKNGLELFVSEKSHIKF